MSKWSAKFIWINALILPQEIMFLCQLSQTKMVFNVLSICLNLLMFNCILITGNQSVDKLKTNAHMSYIGKAFSSIYFTLI